MASATRGALFLAVLAGCTSDREQPASRTAARANPVSGRATTPTTPRVRRLLGDANYVVVPFDDADSAEVVTAGNDADSPIATIDLFSRVGHVATITPQLAPGAQDCRTIAIPDPHSRWRVGFGGGTAVGVPLDSIEEHSGLDSLRIAVAVTKLAARTPADTVSALSGLPYTVRGAWRFPLDSARDGLVAIATRALGLEADPRAEQLFMIAEKQRDSAVWTPRFSERRSGSETDLAFDDLLAVIRIGSAAVVTVERSGDEGRSISLFASDSARTWTALWHSEPSRCRSR